MASASQVRYRMKKTRVITTLLASSVVTYVLAASTLSPKQNQDSGRLPALSEDLHFSVSNGDWVKQIQLPETAQEGIRLKLSSTAAYASEIDLRQLGIQRSNPLVLRAGDSYQFQFKAGQWAFLAPEEARFNPHQHGHHIPSFQARHAEYLISDQAWAETVYLPTTALSGQILVIRSQAKQSTKIHPQGALFASSFILNSNDTYIFQFDQALNKWLPLSVPIHLLSIKNGDVADLEQQLQSLSTPKTELQLGNGAWLPAVKLPQWANDRDRIIIRSTAAWPSKIEALNTDRRGSMPLLAGHYYEFMYVADKAHWVLMSAPKSHLSTKVAAQGFEMQSPLLEIEAQEQQWAAVVQLPSHAQAGDQVVASNRSNRAYDIVAKGLTANIYPGDRQRFIFEQGQWQSDSDQVDLLIVNSPVVNEILGETAAKIQAREALRLSNQAFEQSNTKVYFKEAGYMDYRIAGKTLNEAISLGRHDRVLQAERLRLGADAIYSISDHEGCGLGWVNKRPNKNLMIAAHRYDCGVTAMRHELGHNLGLDHRNTQPTAGQPFVLSIMGGNQVGLFASPQLYSSDYGIRLTEANSVDEVEQINRNAPSIAAFFAAIH